MPNNQFWNLLAKKLAGEATPEEVLELELLMKAHPDLLFAAQHIEDLWHQKNPENAQLSAAAFAAHIHRMKLKGVPLQEGNTEKPASTPLYKRMKALLFAVPICLFVFFIPWLFLKPKSSPKSVYPSEKLFSEIITQPRSRTNLILPDGSKVWLNSGSKLTYNDHFGTDNRTVNLNGEAFFDVKKSTMPFIIHANSVQIKVVGTAFNVKSYSGDNTTETSLLRGRVEITVESRPGEKYILKPNEKLTVSNVIHDYKNPSISLNQALITLEPVTRIRDSSVLETAWINNRLAFQNETFGQLAKRMERWYGVPIKFEDQDLENIRFSGVFTRETVKEALEALQITTSFHFIQREEGIIITH
jgi:transmembrane sensor